MKNALRSMALTAALMCMWAGGDPAAAARLPKPTGQLCAAVPVGAPSHPAAGVEVGTGWTVDRADNICGLDDPKTLSKPAKVDYDTLLRSTAEMKKIKDNKIDLNSPEGIQLRQAAVDRVRNAADKVRQAKGYCSVWKQISHTDGRVIPDITDLVKEQL